VHVDSISDRICRVCGRERFIIAGAITVCPFCQGSIIDEWVLHLKALRPTQKEKSNDNKSTG
jgi:RNA polymerase subunit RPABC4/transcription elongation factor Spt4